MTGIPGPVRNDYYVRNYYIGADFAGGIEDFGLYGEAALHVPEDPVKNNFSFKNQEFGDLLEACVGFDYPFSEIDAQLRVEYYHQGNGVIEKDHYDIMRLITGLQLVQAEDYLVTYLEKSFLDFYKIRLGNLLNCNDKSFVAFPEFYYNAYNNFEIQIGSFMFSGDKGTEFYGEYDIITGMDPVTFMPIIETVDITHPSVYVKFKMSF